VFFLIGIPVLFCSVEWIMVLVFVGVRVFLHGLSCFSGRSYCLVRVDSRILRCKLLFVTRNLFCSEWIRVCNQNYCFFLFE